MPEATLHYRDLALALDDQPWDIVSAADVRELVCPQDWNRVTDHLVERTLTVFDGEPMPLSRETLLTEIAMDLWREGITTYDFALPPRVYVIGPISGHDDLNQPAFETARTALLQAGFECVTIPHDLTRPTDAYEDCMAVSLNHLINHCDLVVTLPGALSSRGASLEISVARIIGRPTATVAEAIARFQRP